MSLRADEDELPDFDAEISQHDEEDTVCIPMASRIPASEVAPPDLPATIPPPPVTTEPPGDGHHGTPASSGSSGEARSEPDPLGPIAPVVEEGTVQVHWPVLFEQRSLGYQCDVKAHTSFLIEIPPLLHNESDKLQLGKTVGPVLGKIRRQVYEHLEMVEHTFPEITTEVWEALWHEAFAGKHGAQWRIECLANRYAKQSKVSVKLLIDMMWQIVECFRKAVQALKEPWQTLKPFIPKKKHHAAWNGLLVATLLPGLSNAPVAVAARMKQQPMDQPHTLPATTSATGSDPTHRRHLSPQASNAAASGAMASAKRQKIGTSPSQLRKFSDLANVLPDAEDD
eukprot:1944049-Amphidinium_carterae.2